MLERRQMCRASLRYSKEKDDESGDALERSRTTEALRRKTLEFIPALVARQRWSSVSTSLPFLLQSAAHPLLPGFVSLVGRLDHLPSTAITFPFSRPSSALLPLYNAAAYSL